MNKLLSNLVVLSLFDGISCGYEALLMAGFRKFIYHASEVEEASIKISKANHPDIKHHGDVRKLRGVDFWMVNMITAGSPCQGFSISGKKKGMTIENIMVTSLKQYVQLLDEGYVFEITKKNQSVLFWEFVRLRKEIDDIRASMGLPPVYFLLENVKMDPFWEMIINDALGCKCVKINSNRLVPQYRERWYWGNFPITIPEDRNPKLSDWVDDAVNGVGWSGDRHKETGDKYIPTLTKNKYGMAKNKFGMANCITTWPPTDKMPGRAYYIKTDVSIKRNDAISLSIEEQKELYGVNSFTIEHLEGLQGLRKGYTNVPGVTDDERRKAIGNGWTVPVISHIFGCLTPLLSELYKEEKINNF